MRKNRVVGKANKRFLQRLIYTRLGAPNRRVVEPPAFGIDNAVVKVGNGQVLVATTDPLSFIPSLKPKESAWLSLHLLASDLTTSGFEPQFGIFDLNLPPGMSDSNLAQFWAAFDHECKCLGITIVGGHTGRYEGCDYTIIGGGVLFAVGPEKRYLVTSMARNGDEIILTKGAAIETTAILTRVFSKTVGRALGNDLFEEAWNYLGKVSTVDDALAAAGVGVRDEGVTAMHDATEGGVVAGLCELAAASGLGVSVDLEEVAISPETSQLCRFFRIDPLTSLSEGTLIITCRPSKTDRILRSLSTRKISANLVGRMTSKSEGCRGLTRRGPVRLSYPDADPYWAAYSKALARGWS